MFNDLMPLFFMQSECGRKEQILLMLEGNLPDPNRRSILDEELKGNPGY
jgi:hypothetical protein